MSFAIDILRARKPVVAAGAFHPRDLFIAAERGNVWDPSDIATLFQNVAGTTPVTAAGQTVGYVTDTSPNLSNYNAAGDNTTRPTYQVDSDGKGYLNFDGVNDVLYAAPFTASPTNARYTIIVGLYSTTTTTKVMLSCQSSTAANPLIQPLNGNSTGGVYGSLRNDSASSSTGFPTLAAFYNNVKRVATTYYSGPGQPWRIRDAATRPAGGGFGNYTGGNSSPTAMNYTVDRSALGAIAGATPGAFFAGRIYAGCVINRVLTDAEIKNLEDWVAARCLTAALP